MAGSNGLASAFKLIGGMFSTLFRNLTGALIWIGILIIFFSAISESIQQKSLQPFLDEIGNRVVKADQHLLEKAQQIEQFGGLPVIAETPVGKIKSITKTAGAILEVFINVYIVFLIGFLIYKIIGSFNQSAGFGNILLTLLFMALILSAFQLLIITQDGLQLGENVASRLVPFKGVFSIIKVSPLIFNPIIQSEFVQNNLPQKTQTNQQPTSEGQQQQQQSQPQNCGADVCL